MFKDLQLRDQSAFSLVKMAKFYEYFLEDTIKDNSLVFKFIALCITLDGIMEHVVYLIDYSSEGTYLSVLLRWISLLTSIYFVGLYFFANLDLKPYFYRNYIILGFVLRILSRYFEYVSLLYLGQQGVQSMMLYELQILTLVDSSMFAVSGIFTFWETAIFDGTIFFIHLLALVEY